MNLQHYNEAKKMANLIVKDGCSKEEVAGKLNVDVATVLARLQVLGYTMEELKKLREGK